MLTAYSHSYQTHLTLADVPLGSPSTADIHFPHGVQGKDLHLRRDHAIVHLDDGRRWPSVRL